MSNYFDGRATAAVGLLLGRTACVRERTPCPPSLKEPLKPLTRPRLLTNRRSVSEAVLLLLSGSAAAAAEGSGLVQVAEDKTFGLKNKNKSAKVQT